MARVLSRSGSAIRNDHFCGILVSAAAQYLDAARSPRLARITPMR